LRGQQKVSLSIGLLSLLVTQTIYPVVLALGYFLLSSNWLIPLIHNRKVLIQYSRYPQSVVRLFESWIPPEGLLLFGLFLVLVSLWVFDKIIPELDLKNTDLGMISHLLYRPIVVFLLGAGITALTMSVSVSLGLLLPLSVRGYVRQENVVPYILGANITTFVDTLIAAALLANSTAISVVLTQMFSVSVVAIFILATSLRFYERTVQRLARWIGTKNIFIFLYILIILGIPII
jgi:Na+/phosphate symporter